MPIKVGDIHKCFDEVLQVQLRFFRDEAPHEFPILLDEVRESFVRDVNFRCEFIRGQLCQIELTQKE